VVFRHSRVRRGVGLNSELKKRRVMIPRGHQWTSWTYLHTYTCRALLFRIEIRLALEAYQIPVNKRPLQSNIPLLCTLVHRRGTLRVGDGGVPFSSRTAAALIAVKRLFAHRSQVTHLLVSRYPQDVTKRAMSPRSGFKAVGVIKVFITNSNLHEPATCGRIKMESAGKLSAHVVRQFVCPRVVGCHTRARWTHRHTPNGSHVHEPRLHGAGTGGGFREPGARIRG